MELDLSLRKAPAPPQPFEPEPERPRPIAELAAIAAAAPSLPAEPDSDASSDDEWRIATGKRGRGTPSPELDPALKMLRTAIDNLPPGATLGEAPALPPLPPLPTLPTRRPTTSGAGPSGVSPGLLREDGGIRGYMAGFKPRRGKERATVQ